MSRWVVSQAVVAKAFIETRRYLLSALSGIGMQCVIFLIIFAGSRSLGGLSIGGSGPGGGPEGLVVAYLVWMLAIMSFEELAGSVARESAVGTLEQLFLTRAGFAWVGISYMIGRYIVILAPAAILLLFMMATTGHWLHLDLPSLLGLFPIVVATPCGLGFIMGGLALVYKHVQAFLQVFIVAFPAALVVPLDQYPWVRFLPLAQGNDLLRRVMVDGLRIWELPVREVAAGVGVGALYLLAGFLFFSYCLKVARDRGTLGQY